LNTSDCLSQFLNESYGGAVRTSTHCRHDANLNIAFQWCAQYIFSPADIVVNEDVHVLAHRSLLSQHAIAQTDMTIPQLIQGVTHGRGRRVNLNLGLASGKFRQVTSDLKSNHVGTQAILPAVREHPCSLSFFFRLL
jgi:hypothetical protein